MNRIYELHTFSGKSTNCYGLEIVKRNLERRGFKIVPFQKRSKNPVLVSLYWPAHIYDFIRWRYQSSYMRDRIIIAGGNYPTTSPQTVLPFCDYVFLGDGELWDGELDSPYIISKDTQNSTEKAIAKNILPFYFEDMQTTRRAFLEISRGCKNKCPFCQYGWLKPYRESDINDIYEVIKHIKTKSVRVFAADRFQHSHYLAIRKRLNNIGKCDTGADVSLKYLYKNREYLKLTNKVRVGVEGMSERLRKMVCKPFTNDQIIEFCELVYKAGIKCLDFYMIYGLPTECQEDIEGFKELIIGIDKVLPNDYVIAMHWNAFSPSAQTPFQWEKPAYGDYANFKKALDTRITKMTIYHKPKLTNDRTVIQRTLAIRGGESTAKLIYNYAMHMAKFDRNPKFVLDEFRKATGVEMLEEWPQNRDLPWDKFCVYEKEKMRRVGNKVKEIATRAERQTKCAS